GLAVITVTALIDNGMSQTNNAVIPLWPCYSVYKLEPTGNVSVSGNNTMTTRYRYVNRFPTPASDVYDPENPGKYFIQK
ncbi:hypothetical protein L9F63_026303, partial [Diploptera punctata]